MSCLAVNHCFLENWSWTTESISDRWMCVELVCVVSDDESNLPDSVCRHFLFLLCLQNSAPLHYLHLLYTYSFLYLFQFPLDQRISSPRNENSPLTTLLKISHWYLHLCWNRLQHCLHLKLRKCSVNSDSPQTTPQWTAGVKRVWIYRALTLTLPLASECVV